MSLSLLAFVAITFVAAMSGAIFKPGEWYERLEKPSWNPPKWAFPVVWTILYAMIATAGWLVWQKVGFSQPLVWLLYGAQLVLNAAWSAIFFGKKQVDTAFFECVAMWAAIFATILVFWPIDPLAAGLMVPYLIWVTIAAALNRAIWRLNGARPQFDGVTS